MPVLARQCTCLHLIVQANVEMEMEMVSPARNKTTFCPPHDLSNSSDSLCTGQAST